MAKLPKFISDEEIVAWFDVHDSSEYMDDMEIVEKDFDVIRTPFATRPLDIRIREDHLATIQTIAERKGIPYQMLIQGWLLEKLNEEASDLAIMQ